MSDNIFKIIVCVLLSAIAIGIWTLVSQVSSIPNIDKYSQCANDSNPKQCRNELVRRAPFVNVLPK